jgi:sterol desaturase/sphingolipid hydroxylase (fatty acid hydroxylase superfamily)
MTNYIALAIPVFLMGIGIEVLIARRVGRRPYRFADAVADLGCGVAQQAAGLPVAAALLAGYAWLWEHHRLVELRTGSPWPWLIAFVGVDLIYYWWHRLSHRVNLLWAAHVVHHQSEDYNLAVALRQAILTDYTAWPFYLPLALLGVPPIVYATIHSFSTLYQFWIHTELVGRPGPLGSVLNMPSHHRVHHAINPRYLDKNYGATLIVWDRLFGTFEEEHERPVYGVTKPLGSFNPLWAQLEPVVALARAALQAPRLVDKLRAPWMPPDWRPAGAPPHEPLALDRPKYAVAPSRPVVGYVFAQFALIIAGTFFLLLYGLRLPAPALAAAVALLLASVAVSAGLLEGRRWAWPAEALRLALVVAGLAALTRLA